MPADRPDFTRYGMESLWLDEAPTARTLLVVGAHPDDEIFFAGTLLHARADGIAVHYACATRGECSTVAPAILSGYPDVVALRMDELRCSARTLGLAAVHLLGYRDSGMPGSPDNEHPKAFVQAPAEHVTGQLVALIRAVRPQVVLTFGPYGGYGHPDHIRVHEATCDAFAAAGDPTRYAEQCGAMLAPWRPIKLYYSTFGTRVVRALITLQRLFRKDPRRFGKNGDVDLVRVAHETTPITASIDVTAYLQPMKQAWRCHRSQVGDLAWILRLPAWLRRYFVGTEHFTRVVPPPAPDEARERDLFAGLRSE
jgi:LmbE family N-acetylglucosaminyl deacetylase